MTADNSREDPSADLDPPDRGAGVGIDRAGVEFWDRARADQISGEAPSRSAVKRFLDRRVDQLFVSLLSAVPEAGSLLEIGCAPGWILARVGRLRPDIELHGIDYAPRGVQETESLLDRVGISATIALADMRAYAPEMALDAVLSAGLLEHYDDPVPVVANHARIAGPGNAVIVTVPNFAPSLARATFRWADTVSFETHNLDLMEPERLREVLLEAGLGGVEMGSAGGSRLYVPPARGLSLNRALYRVVARVWNAVFALLPGFMQPWEGYVWARGRVPVAMSDGPEDSPDD